MDRDRVTYSDGAEPLYIWAERDLQARLVIDDDLHIGWHNDAAIALLGEADMFMICQGTLTTRSQRSKAIFRSFVRSSAAQLSTLCLEGRGSLDHVLCTAINLVNGSRPRRTGITLRRASDVVSGGTRHLQAAFNLTMCERTVVETLFAGQTAEQIGSALQLSVGTIRMHIRHIYDKLHVSSREAMFHKLIPFMLLR